MRRQPLVTAQRFEQRMAQARAEENRFTDLHRRVRDNEVMTANYRSDHIVNAKRRTRQNEERSAEKLMDENIQKDEQRMKAEDILREQEQELALIMQARNVRDETAKAEHRRICEDSEELKDLHAKLKAARMNKDRALQVEQSRIRKEHEKQEILDLEIAMEKKLQLDMIEEERAEIEKAKHSVQAKSVLLEQLSAKRKQEEFARNEFLKEKEQVDKIVREIEEEDLRKEKARREKMLETKHLIEGYQKERKQFLRQKKADEREETAKLLAWQKLQDSRTEGVQAKKDMELAEQAARYRRVKDEVENQNRIRESQQELLNELYRVELALKAQEGEIKEKKQQQLMRERISRENHAQRIMKAEAKLVEMAEEEKIKQSMLAKFKKDDEEERQKFEAQKLKVVELKKERSAIIEERQSRFEKQREREIIDREQTKKLSEDKANIIEDERKRLLVEYAVELRDFLTKGVLKDETDRDLVYGKDSN